MSSSSAKLSQNTCYLMNSLLQGLKKEEVTSETVEVRVAVPGYCTTHHTNREDMLRYVMRAAKEAGADYVHGYGAFAYEECFKNLVSLIITGLVYTNHGSYTNSDGCQPWSAA